jgi:hypothetical protein
MPGVTANATYSKELKIEAPSNKLIRLGAAAGAVAALMLVVALYANLVAVSSSNPDSSPLAGSFRCAPYLPCGFVRL